MSHEIKLNVPPTEIEIAELLSQCESLTGAGRMIIRRLAFERDTLKVRIKMLESYIDGYRKR